MGVYTATDLRQMQSLPLEAKIVKSQERIKEYYDYFNGEVYVSFSGGKDSTVLLHLVRELYPDVRAMFVDTGLEYPEVKEFVKSQENVTIVRPSRTYKQVIERFGYPMISKMTANCIATARRDPNSTRAKYLTGEIPTKAFGYGNGRWWPMVTDAPFKTSGYCCEVMKKQPAHKFNKETGLVPFIATLADESVNRRLNWYKEGCNSFKGKDSQSKPLSFWTDQDIYHYLKDNNIPYCPLYGDIVENEKGELVTTGIERTGCIFCGFGAHLEKEPNRFQQLKKTHPKLWDYCMRPIEENGLGMREVCEFMKIPIE